MKAPKKQTASAKKIQAAQKAASASKKQMQSDYKKQLKKEETGIY